MVNNQKMPESTDQEASIGGQKNARERILIAARRVFAEHGLSGARVDAVAREAGCTKGLVLHYFGSKKGLWEAVLAYYLGMGERSAFLAGTASPDIDGVERFIRRTFRFFQTHPDFNALANRAATQSDLQVPEGMLDLLRQAQRSFARAQTQGLIQKEFAAAEAQLVVYLLISGWFTYRDLYTQSKEKRMANSGDDEAFFAAMLKVLAKGVFAVDSGFGMQQPSMPHVADEDMKEG